MVTGDNPQTAKAIALECGILSSAEDAVEPNVIEGRVFREYSDSEREDIAEKISVRINCLHLLLVFSVFVYLQIV
jgi:Ca2+-transporting ATPase